MYKISQGRVVVVYWSTPYGYWYILLNDAQMMPMDGS